MRAVPALARAPRPEPLRKSPLPAGADHPLGVFEDLQADCVQQDLRRFGIRIKNGFEPMLGELNELILDVPPFEWPDGDHAELFQFFFRLHGASLS
jgi:hypothetical protein